MNHIINQLLVFTEGNPSHKPIIFVHGFPYDHSMWNKQVEYFKQKYFCVTYDIRGLGQSPASHGQFTMEMFVDDLEAIIRELKLDKPVLCGLSMGGYISLRALVRFEEKFSAVILCDTRSDSDDNAGRLKRSGAIKRISDEGLEGYAKDFISTCFGDEFKEKNQEEFEKIIERSSAHNPAGVKGSQLAMLSRTDTTDYLEKIKIPSLIICGEYDALTPPSVMNAMADKIPGSTFVVIKNSGHMSPIEQPDKVNAAMNDFLEKLL
ncbi:MAG: alpha/beta fold hydrolase [Ignavibacteriales bacterium]|nr:MAG: alpha/beta fold hydrolase [Ignavibacteriales bacterium]